MSILDDKFSTTKECYRKNRPATHIGSEFFEAEKLAAEMNKYEDDEVAFNEAKRLGLFDGLQNAGVDDIAKALETVRQQYFDKAVDYVKAYMLENTHEVINEEGESKRDLDVVPVKIRQLVSYIIYYYNKYNLDFTIRVKGCTQEQILDYFSIRKNQTQKWGIQPLQILAYENYVQPVNPAGYKGIKSGNLGVALRFLEYQAGSYKHFVDLFGGSGTASTAVPCNNSKKYHCNELGDNNFIHLWVLNHKGLKDDFVKAILDIKASMNNGSLLSGINYDKVGYYENQYRLDDKGDLTSPVSNTDASNAVLSAIEPDTLDKYNTVVNTYTKEYNAVLTYWRFFRNIYWGVPAQNMLDDGANLIWGTDIVIALSEFFLERFSLNGVQRTSIDAGILKDISESKRIKRFLDTDDSDLIKEYNEFFDRFKNVSLVKGDAMRILQTRKVIPASDSYQDAVVGIDNLQAIPDNENILYYSDSPYLGTVGYSENDDDDFTTEDMYNLIHSLKESGEKFIFSCRYNHKPNLSDKEFLFRVLKEQQKQDKKNNIEIGEELKKFSDYTEEELDELLSAFDADTVYDKLENKEFQLYFDNYKIIKYIFKVFESEFGVLTKIKDIDSNLYDTDEILFDENTKERLITPLWVAEIKSDNKGIDNEIMITNYPIHTKSEAYEADTFDRYMVDFFKFYEDNKNFYDSYL